MHSPDDFLDKLNITGKELVYLHTHKIFTIRQLAECDCSIIERQEKNDTLLQHYNDALQIIISYIKPTKKREREVDLWGYCYIGEELYNAIKNGADYKSPYVLFEEYMQCKSAEEKNKHLWKTVYLFYARAAAAHLKVEVPTDSDVYSYLTWKDSQTIGQFDTTASTRAIPFVWEWMSGDLHGQCIVFDKILAVDVNDLSIADRYSHQIAINLSQLCDTGAKMYKVERFNATSTGLNSRKWIATSLEQEESQNTRKDLWINFNPGEDYAEKVPHGCIVLPDGIIPRKCIHVFETADVAVREINF